MAIMAEGMARVASGIATDRKHRSELAMEIKAITRSRCTDVHSFLKSLKVSRNKASRERMADASKMMRARHNEVHVWLKGLKTDRGKSASEHQKEAQALNKTRQSDVKALLKQFAKEGVASQKHFRESAATFIKGLSTGVAALLDGFDKLDSDRATALREQFAGYAADRHEAMAVWHGSHEGHQRASHDSAAMPADGHAKAPVAAGRPGEPHFAAEPTDANNQPSRRPFVNLSHGGTKGPHKGESK